MYLFDSSHVWHVAKSGSDTNGGHAQQYPISLASDAKLTIQAAVNVASDGDKIVIWPGTYSESVDATSKQLHLVGTSRENCVIQIVQIGSNSSLANLSVVVPATVANAAMLINTKDNIVIENCFFETLREEQAGYGCLRIDDSSNIVIRNSYINASGYGIRAFDSGVVLEGCWIKSTARFTYQNAAGLYFTNSAGKLDRQVLAVDCKFILDRNYSISSTATASIVAVDQTNRVFTVEGDASGTFSQGDKVFVVLSAGNDGQYTVSGVEYDNEEEQSEVTVSESIPDGTADGQLGKSSTEPAHGVLCNGFGTFNNCVVYAGGGSYTASDVKGVTVLTDKRMLLNCCSIFTEENHASATAYDVYNEGTIVAVGSIYEANKVSGTVVQGGSGWAEGVNAEVDKAITDASVDKAVKMLMNKAVQNKVTGSIQYYGDGGQTVILTHTPSESQTEITRMPS